MFFFLTNKNSETAIRDHEEALSTWEVRNDMGLDEDHLLQSPSEAGVAQWVDVGPKYQWDTRKMVDLWF